MRLRSLVLLVGLCWIAGQGCSNQAQQSAENSNAYRPDPGPYPVATTEDVELPFASLDKALHLRITHPADGNGPFPVVIFSHGGRCSHAGYDYFANHWASYGYIVIQPGHLDSSSVPPSELRGMQMMNVAVSTRRLDMIHILDSFPTIGTLVPELAGRIDGDRVVAAGHSMGGGTAMSVTGLVMVDPRDDSQFGFLDERFDALLLITNPGNSPMMPDDPWRAVGLPTFVATGTNDFSGLVKHIKKSSSVYKYPDDIEFLETPNHYLFIEDMNHYMGGLICKPRDGEEPDADAARIIGGISVAFLDAYIKEDAAAQAFLRASASWQAEPRARFSLR